jgi:phosphoribosylanthranilate isomerase
MLLVGSTHLRRLKTESLLLQAESGGLNCGNPNLLHQSVLFMNGSLSYSAKTIMRPRVKICCIKSPEEARLAIACGAAAVGLVSRMPSGPGVIDEAAIASITAVVPPPVATFLLTSARDADEIIAQQRRCRTNTLQLCDYVELSVYDRLRASLPGVALVQVLHVTGDEVLAHAQAIAAHVDALLLDSGNPTLAVKQLGGTGRVHDWGLSCRIRDGISKPIFLAGGLSRENVCAAIATVQPFGLDLCSGVRTNDMLDEQKLRGFFEAIDGVHNQPMVVDQPYPSGVA